MKPMPVTTCAAMRVTSALLDWAKALSPGRLVLWTFQRNANARRFYEAHGFALVRETDGSDNEEKEPDALYLWTRDGANHFPTPKLP